jgi:hypothetical protein
MLRQDERRGLAPDEIGPGTRTLRRRQAGERLRAGCAYQNGGWLLAAGTPGPASSEVLGHANARSTLRTCAHLLSGVAGQTTVRGVVVWSAALLGER